MTLRQCAKQLENSNTSAPVEEAAE